MQCLKTIAQKIFAQKILLIMNFIAAALLIFCLQVSAAGFSQEKISLKVKNEEIGRAIAKIEKLTSYRFLYNSELKEIKHKVSLDVKDAKVSDVLDLLLSNAGLTFELINDRLIAIKKENVRDVAITVSGRVINERKEPLPGVNVKVKNEVSGTMTNEEGRYSISVPDKGAVL